MLAIVAYVDRDDLKRGVVIAFSQFPNLPKVSHRHRAICLEKEQAIHHVLFKCFLDCDWVSLDVSFSKKRPHVLLRMCVMEDTKFANAGEWYRGYPMSMIRKAVEEVEANEGHKYIIASKYRVSIRLLTCWRDKFRLEAAIGTPQKH